MTELPHGASPVDAIVPGTRLREWEVLNFRGRGSFGVVFEARRSSWLDESPRALKVFDPIFSSAARHTLLEEFSALTEVHHPHLLQGIDAFDLDTEPHAGCVVFVLELAEEDLATRVARLGRLEAAHVAAVGAEVADGLQALHDKGRVHGDVKPENILRVGERWVLGDFGVTGVLEGSYAVTPGATVDYRPPELANAQPGSRLHRSTDVWALGVSLHVAATGRHPFPGPDPMLRYAAVVRGDRAPSPDLDPGLAETVESGCLQPEPRARAGAAELRDRLRAVAGVGTSSPLLTDEEVQARAATSPESTSPEPTAPTASDPADLAGATLDLAAATVPTGSTPPAGPTIPAGSTVPTAAEGLDTESPDTRVGGLGRARLFPVVVAIVATAAVCQVVALAAGLLPFELETRRAVYVLVSAGVLGVGLEPAAQLVRRRSGTDEVPWSRLRPLALVAMVLAWLVATALLFGIVG